MATCQQENLTRFLQTTGREIEGLKERERSTMQINCTKVATSAHLKNTSENHTRELKKTHQRFRKS